VLLAIATPITIMRINQLFSIAVISCGLLFTAGKANAQSQETQKALIVTTTEEDEIKTDTVEMCVKPSRWSLFVNADGGGTNLETKAAGKTNNSTGYAWALGGNIGYRLSGCCNNRMILAVSAGVEIRNFNTINKSTDKFGGTAYDNLHYWYAGIPLMLNLETNHCGNSGNGCCCKSKRLGFYAQGGVIFSFKLYNNSYYSVQGENTTYDITRHFTDVIYQPVLSLGITYPVSCATLKVGPFATYTPESIMNNSNPEERVLSYGLRLIASFDK